MVKPKILPDLEVAVNENYERRIELVCWGGVDREILIYPYQEGWVLY
jgi:hypothetical protein